MQKLRIGVVPEHFSIPFHLGFERKIFENQGIDLAIEEFPRGTGSMCRSLRQDEIDVAVALTEGIIADIATSGDAFQIIATYVASPLHWGVFVHPDSNIASISELKGKSFGISRFGSGSHLMVSLLAFERHWDLDHDVKFEVKGGLQDLVGGISDKSADAFLWEKFTTKHCEQENKVRFIGEKPTPWPSFMVAARKELIENQPQLLNNLLAGIQESTKLFLAASNNLDLISKTSKLSLEDSKKWLHETKFSDNCAISKSMLENTINILVQTKILKEKIDYKLVCAEKVGIMEE